MDNSGARVRSEVITLLFQDDLCLQDNGVKGRVDCGNPQLHH